MLINVIGLGGRIGRMQYFLRSLISVFVMIVATFVLAMTASPQAPGDTSANGFSPTGLFLMILVIVGLPFLWFTLMIHVKRIRDIGWSPLYVILAWIVVNVLDGVLVTVAPALAIAGEHQTWLAFTVNLGLVGCLLFWPSNGDADDGPHPFDTPYRAPIQQRSVAGSPPPAPRASRPAAPPTPTGFGRRGL